MQRSWFRSRPSARWPLVSTASFITTTTLAVAATAGGPVAWDDTVEMVARMPDVHGPHAVFLADLDNDRDLDIAVASEHAPRLVWYANGGPGSEWSANLIHDGMTAATAVIVTDLDGDRLPDVVAAMDGIRWFKNEGSAASWTPYLIHEPTEGDAITSLTIADIDGDGDRDVVSASSTSNTVRWHRNEGATGEGLWPAERIVDDARGVAMIAAVDFDGDRDVDLLSAEAGANRVRLFTNSGGPVPAWEPTIVSKDIDGAHGVWTSDVDGNGRLDVITAADRGHAIAWHAFNEHGEIKHHAIVADAKAPWTVQPVDLDGDGDLDFVAGIRDALRPVSGPALRWYENDGATPPAFTAHALPEVQPAASAVRDIAVRDIDGNGLMDVVTVWNVGHAITVHRTIETTPESLRTVQEQ